MNKYCANIKTSLPSVAMETMESFTGPPPQWVGCSNPLSSSALSELAVQQFESAIAMMANEYKAEYMEAIQRAPALVAKETKPMRFLRTDGMNPWSAANRMTLYWKYRKEIFGKDRWLLPMDLTGDGALDRDEAEGIKQIVLLFKKQSGGVAVHFSDFAGVHNVKVNVAVFAERAAYYVFTNLEDQDIETHGFVWIHARDPKSVPCLRSSKGRPMELLRRALPLRVLKTFFLLRQDRSEPRFDKSIPVLAFLSEFYLGAAPEFISDARKTEAFQKLRAQGLSEFCIPSFLGGTWEINHVLYSRYARNSRRDYSGDGSLYYAHSTEWNMSAYPGSSQQSTLEKSGRGKINVVKDVNFLKKRQAAYSRKNFYKKKGQIEKLEADTHRLKMEHSHLKKENERLSGLVTQVRLQFPFLEGL